MIYLCRYCTLDCDAHFREDDKSFCELCDPEIATAAILKEMWNAKPNHIRTDSVEKPSG